MSSTPEASRTVRVGVLGLGVMGRQHARVLATLPGAELVAVCDVSPDARLWAETRFGVPTIGRLENLISLQPDAVINATPTGAHADTTRPVLDEGISTLVEKPLALSLPEALELVALAERNSTLLMVGHVERFNPAVWTLKQLIDSGELGTILSVHARRVGIARPAIPETDVTMDLAIHDIDVISLLLGRPGKLVLATGSKLGSNRFADHADLVLEYGDTRAFLQANWITPVKIRRLTVTGTQGTAEMDYIGQTIHVFDSVPELIKGETWDFFAVATESEPRDIPVKKQEPLLLELAHFLSHVTNGGSRFAKDNDAIAALSLAAEAHQRIAESTR